MSISHQKLLRAAEFAANAHRDQRRKDQFKAPYINHSLQVAWLIAENVKMTAELSLSENPPKSEESLSANMLENILIAGLLHDVVEDTPVSLETICALFGDEVGSVVAEVTDDKTLSKSNRKRRQLEHIAERSLGAQIIKLADKISNCMSLKMSVPESWTLQRAQGYFAWSRAMVLKIPRIPAITALHDLALLQTTGTFVYNGKTEPCIPVDESKLDDFVENYLATC